MKLLSTLLGLLATFLSIGPAAAVLPGVENWWGKCHSKHPAIASAIHNFCDLAGYSNHVPRQWSIMGQHSDQGKFDRDAWVGIGGNCNPQQWVPKKYCYLQFYQMCVQDAGAGGGLRTYGGCQSWEITRAGVPGGMIGN